MYKVNINAAFFETNFKRVKQSRETQMRPIYFLTEQQKQYIESLFPKKYKLNIVNEINEKRNRMPKKTGLEFDVEFGKRCEKKEGNNGGSAHSDKKYMGKQQRKQKTKLDNPNGSMEKQEQHNKNEEEIPDKSNQPAEENRNGSPDDCEQQQKICQINKMEERKDGELRIVKNQQMHKYEANRKSVEQESNAKKEEERQVKVEQMVPLAKPQISIKEENIEISIENSSVSNLPKSYQLFHEQKQLCLRFINKLKYHKSSWPFRIPVDPVAQGVPNYLAIIHEPMDLKTIEKKIISNKYEHISQFHADLNKIFLNSYKFNPKQTNYYTLTAQLESYYHQLQKQLEMHPSVLDSERVHKTTKNKVMTKNSSEQDFIEQNNVNIKKKKSTTTLSHHKTSTTEDNNIGPVGEQNWREGAAKLFESCPLVKVQKMPNQRLKPRYSSCERKELVKKILGMSSNVLENIVNVVYGETEENRTMFELHFDEFSDDTITKIENLLRNEQQNLVEESKNYYGMETRMQLF